MLNISKDNFSFLVDVEKTREYYRNSTLCDCEYCQYFHSQIPGRFPELEAFLEEFGIDTAKPDETIWYENGDTVFYDFAGYTVCGKILNAPSEEMKIEGERNFTIICNEGFAFPNEQKEDYFSFTVSNFEFPLPETKTIVPKKRLKFFEHRGKRKEQK